MDRFSERATRVERFLVERTFVSTAGYRLSRLLRFDIGSGPGGRFGYFSGGRHQQGSLLSRFW